MIHRVELGLLEEVHEVGNLQRDERTLVRDGVQRRDHVLPVVNVREDVPSAHEVRRAPLGADFARVVRVEEVRPRRHAVALG